jgi:hypothetical protein
MPTPRFACAKGPAPLLNSPDFSTSFNRLPLDEHKLLRTVETVVLPRTKLRILEKTEHPHIVQVSTSEYPYEGAFFTDVRLLELATEEPSERPIVLPSGKEILEEFDRLLGVSYIWGGNWPEGIPELKEFYPEPIEPDGENTKTLKGVDCTGLLYYITNGYTPRNTSKFVSWGKLVPIAGFSIDEILSTLKPLDAIVWPGHIVSVYNSTNAIESRWGQGVVKIPLKERLAEIMQTRQPADEALPNGFFIRRWYPDLLEPKK